MKSQIFSNTLPRGRKVSVCATIEIDRMLKVLLISTKSEIVMHNILLEGREPKSKMVYRSRFPRHTFGECISCAWVALNGEYLPVMACNRGQLLCVDKNCSVALIAGFHGCGVVSICYSEALGKMVVLENNGRISFLEMCLDPITGWKIGSSTHHQLCLTRVISSAETASGTFYDDTVLTGAKAYGPWLLITTSWECVILLNLHSLQGRWKLLADTRLMPVCLVSAITGSVSTCPSSDIPVPDHPTKDIIKAFAGVYRDIVNYVAIIRADRSVHFLIRGGKDGNYSVRKFPCTSLYRIPEEFCRLHTAMKFGLCFLRSDRQLLMLPNVSLGVAHSSVALTTCSDLLHANPTFSRPVTPVGTATPVGDEPKEDLLWMVGQDGMLLGYNIEEGS